MCQSRKYSIMVYTRHKDYDKHYACIAIISSSSSQIFQMTGTGIVISKDRKVVDGNEKLFQT